MPYQRLLEELIADVPGAVGALMLDWDGEVVVEAGARDYRHRLIGAYQGIGLVRLREVAERYQSGGIDLVLCRYEAGALIVRPLREGYFLVMSIAPGGSVARGLHSSQVIGQRLADEL